MTDTDVFSDADRRRWAKGWARRRSQLIEAGDDDLLVSTIAGAIVRDMERVRRRSGFARALEAAIAEALRKAGWS